MSKFTVVLIAAALLLAAPVLAEEKKEAKAPAAAAGGELQTDEQKTLYALGIWLSNRVAPLNLSAADLPFVRMGFDDGVLGHDKKVDLKVYGPKIDEMAKSRASAVASIEKKSGEAFAAKMAAEKGAVKKPSGLVYIEETAGKGAAPTATDKVKVNYTGTLIDGTVFDSSAQHGQPAEFGLNGVIKCWTEGLQLMKVGGKAKLICPSDIAYGDTGNSSIKAGATLVFEVELLDIVKPEPPKAK